QARLGPGRPDGPDAGGDPADGAGRARATRNGLLVAAVLVSGLALAVSLMPFGGTDADSAIRTGAEPGPVADPGPYPPAVPAPTASASGSASPGTPQPPSEGAPGPAKPDPDPEPQGSTTATAPTAPRTTAPSRPAVCHAAYDLVNQWPVGFQATVTVTTTEPLDSWRVAFTFEDGQRVTQMWDAEVSQNGPRVTATAADYNRTAPAGGKLAFGFIASWNGTNSPPSDITLNGHSCTTM
ncbi:cellulose binding domain-containing protein, partial [Streptomyces sp. M2CJ-2]|uniref:cellulose binding domain-containing protein n=1 Tax=Streptomyces sp. M2CJ-2 TaxID=2803948 RepID=UPI00192748E0